MERHKPFTKAFDHAKGRAKAVHGELSTAERNSLPDSAFALPNRRYPIHDANHARNALARVSEFGTPEEKQAVQSAVHARYPDIGTMKKQEAHLEATTKKKGAAETRLEQQISSATGKPYVGKR
jgi:hypothetical protein